MADRRVWVADRFESRGSTEFRVRARLQHRQGRLRPLRPAGRPRRLPAGPAVADARRGRGRRHCAAAGGLRGSGGGRGRPWRAVRPRDSRWLRRRRRLRSPGMRGRRRRVSLRARDRRTTGARRLERRRLAQAGDPEDAASRRRGACHALHATSARPATKDLGVVVVVYNMRRAARRTLHSLSRSYQQGIDDLDYEVIVVENGSDPEQRLGEELVRSFGAEFRYIDLGDERSPSPARAINRGIAASTAQNLAVMIDGAHLLTPGVLHYAMEGCPPTRPRSSSQSTGTSGPGSSRSRWRAATTRSSKICSSPRSTGPPTDTASSRSATSSATATGSTVTGRATASSCRGAWSSRRAEWTRASPSPGGGFVNLDFYERMVCSPGVNLVTMLGEGTFHQVHGGTTTNVAEPDELVKSYEDEYAELRGRRFYVPLQQAHYVGRLPPAALRIRPRRMSSFQRFKDALPEGDRQPTVSACAGSPGSKAEFIDAFWRSGEWHRTTWLGKSTHRAPTDLFAYQELICRLRPDWIVETRTGAGGAGLVPRLDLRPDRSRAGALDRRLSAR